MRLYTLGTVDRLQSSFSSGEFLSDPSYLGRQVQNSLISLGLLSWSKKKFFPEWYHIQYNSVPGIVLM